MSIPNENSLGTRLGKFIDSIINVVFRSPRPVDHEITQILQEHSKILRELRAQGAKVMAGIDDINTILGAIDTETNAIAAEITDLQTQIAAGATGGISPSDTATLVTRLGALSTRLQGIAADPANPVPTPPPADQTTTATANTTVAAGDQSISGT